jgi:hypothetical protein
MFTGVRHCCRGSIYLQVTGVAVGVSISAAVGISISIGVKLL